MKTLLGSALFAVTVLSLVIVACAPATSTVGGKCNGGVCVSLKISEPVPFNQSVPVTITVETDQDETGLRIGIDSDKRTVVIEGENLWTVDTKSRTPITVTTNIRFTQEGYFPVIAGATRSIGITARDSIPVHVTRAGVTLNPPLERLPGTPAPAIQIVPCDNPIANPPNMCTPTPGPLQTPQPTGKPQLLNITTRQDVNLAIPDSGTWLTHTFPITTALANATVSLVGVKLSLAHSRAQDLVVEIVAPDTQTVYRIWDRRVPSEANGNPTRMTIGTPDPSRLQGQSVNGDWVVRLRDDVAGRFLTPYRIPKVEDPEMAGMWPHQDLRSTSQRERTWHHPCHLGTSARWIPRWPVPRWPGCGQMWPRFDLV